MTGGPPASDGILPVGRQRYIVALLTLAALCQFVDRSIIGIILPSLRLELALSDAQLGLIAGAAFSIPFACAVLPMGALADRVNRAQLLTLLLALWSVATMISGLAPGIAMLLAMRAVVGLAEAGGGPASLSLLSSIIPAQRRGTAIGIFMLANAGGTLVTFGAGGFLVAAYGWRVAFLIAGAGGLVLAAILLVTLGDLDRQRRDVPSGDIASAMRVLWRLIRQPELRNLALGSAFATALMVGLWAWAASFFVRVHGVALPIAGLIVAAGAGLLAGCGTVLAGWLTDRIGIDAALRMPAWTLGIVTACCLALAAAGSVSGAICAFLLASLVAPMFLAPSYHAILSLVVPAERGIALAGVQMATSVLGSALGPATVGIVSAISGSLSIALAVLSVAGVAAMLFFRRARQLIVTDQF